MDYFTDALKKYADFTGRASRTAYWMFVLLYIVFYIVASIVDVILGSMFFASIYSLALLVPSISIAARRLHDTGRSGWWQLLMFIPILGWIVLLVFLVQASDGNNEYGPAATA